MNKYLFPKFLYIRPRTVNQLDFRYLISVPKKKNLVWISGKEYYTRTKTLNQFFRKDLSFGS